MYKKNWIRGIMKYMIITNQMLVTLEYILAKHCGMRTKMQKDKKKDLTTHVHSLFTPPPKYRSQSA